MIRLYTASDLDAVYEIYRHYVLYSAAIFDREPVSKEEFGASLARLQGKMPLFVSVVDGAIIGYGYVHPAFVKAAYEHDYELTIYFKPGKHHGEPKKMLGLLETAVRQMNGVWLISCITESNRPSIAFHQRNGYTFYGELPNAGLKNGMWHGVCWFAKQLANHDQVTRKRARPIPFDKTELFKVMEENA